MLYVGVHGCKNVVKAVRIDSLVQWREFKRIDAGFFCNSCHNSKNTILAIVIFQF